MNRTVPLIAVVLRVISSLTAQGPLEELPFNQSFSLVTVTGTPPTDCPEEVMSRSLRFLGLVN